MKKHYKALLSVMLCATLVLMASCSNKASGGTPSGSAPSGGTATTAAPEGFTPTHPVEIVTHSGVGGGGDLIGRAVIAATQEFVPQPMVMVNKQGGAGNNEWNYIQEKGKDDGHYLIVATPTNLLWTNQGQNNMRIAVDLIPVINLQIEPQMVVVPANSKWNTMEEFLEDYKTGNVQMAGDVAGGAAWMFAMVLNSTYGVDPAYIPFDDSAQALTALLGNKVEVTFCQMSEAIEQQKGGLVKFLAFASDERVEGFDDIPTLKELGIDYSFDMWRGLFLPGTASPEAVKYWDETIKKGYETDSFQKWIADSKGLPGYMGPEEFKKFVEDQDALIKELLTKYGGELVQ